jgi:hypothetical protein
MGEPNCELCGEPMPEGEGMFKFHGYSGPCPKPPLQKVATPSPDPVREALHNLLMSIDPIGSSEHLETKAYLLTPELRKACVEARAALSATQPVSQPNKLEQPSSNP